jgi:ARG/rhodanese/phosphatase superfamily protein
VLLMAAGVAGSSSTADKAPINGEYKLLAPISHGDLTIFPVIAARAHDTSGFLTLDEGIRSGEVVVTEVGNISGMIRRRRPLPQGYRGAEVNRLILVNNSKRPLILLAGEVVTGGRQDRVVGKDRIVPAESDPVDLSVFCVEPGRWVGSSTKFDTHASVMAQPSVRKRAMVDADQHKVWDEVNAAKANMTSNIRANAPAASGGTMAALRELDSTTSYAVTIDNSAVKQQVESITAPMQKSYESVIKQLRNQNAVGVVVAVKGKIVWADIFASTALLDKYWPKLLQSYAAESLTATGSSAEVSMTDAQRFLDDWQARHETVDSEPGLYRQRELVGDRFRAFELTSLLAKANFDVHLSKMAE